MVVAGGIAQVMMLPLIGSATIYLSRRHLPDDIQPAPVVTAFLWISSIVMLGFALYDIGSRLG